MQEKPLKKYSAPALEKGLDILELLSSDSASLSTSTIADKLGRSSAEIYRMILVLEQRGYIEKIDGSEGYQVSRKLLQLGTQHEPIKDILEYAQPVLRELAVSTAMSCHLAVESLGQAVVITRAEAPCNISFSVRVGFRMPLIKSATGRVLFINQSQAKKELLISSFEEKYDPTEITAFLNDCKKASKLGYVRASNAFVADVTDLSFPIIDTDHAVASLTIPFIQRTFDNICIESVIEKGQQAASELSKAITYGGVRPF